jgi:four helix bundle protein
MAKVEYFEDLKCWQMSRIFIREIYQVSSSGNLSKDFGTRDQLRRAALSIMNNIAEGFARYSRKDFILFLNYAQSSAAEVKSMLYVCEDLTYFSQEEAHALHEQVDSIKKSILALIKYLSTSQKKYTGISGSRLREPEVTYDSPTSSYQISTEHLI